MCAIAAVRITGLIAGDPASHLIAGDKPALRQNDSLADQDQQPDTTDQHRRRQNEECEDEQHVST
jgi:hypothetical protein